MHHWQWRGLGVLAAGFLLAFPANAQKLQLGPKTDAELKQANLAKRYFPSLRSDPTGPAGTALAQQSRTPGKAPQRIGRVAAYVAVKGDTLASIATRFRVSVRDLARANGIAIHDRISDGQVLAVPRPSRKAPPPGTPYGDKNSSYVETALQYRGVPYRWAGMSTRGVDCSGLVSLVLRTNGVEAPHSAARLYKLGVAVPAEALESGDLVFFSTRGRGVSHVGIYVGEGKFIHASSRSHQVTINSLSEKYYQQHFVGAKRIES